MVACIFCGGIFEIWLIGLGVSCLGCFLRKKFKKHKGDCSCGCHTKHDTEEENQDGNEAG